MPSSNRARSRASWTSGRSSRAGSIARSRPGRPLSRVGGFRPRPGSPSARPSNKRERAPSRTPSRTPSTYKRPRQEVRYPPLRLQGSVLGYVISKPTHLQDHGQILIKSLDACRQHKEFGPVEQRLAFEEREQNKRLFPHLSDQDQVVARGLVSEGNPDRRLLVDFKFWQESEEHEAIFDVQFGDWLLCDVVEGVDGRLRASNIRNISEHIRLQDPAYRYRNLIARRKREYDLIVELERLEKEYYELQPRNFVDLSKGGHYRNRPEEVEARYQRANSELKQKIKDVRKELEDLGWWRKLEQEHGYESKAYDRIRYGYRPGQAGVERRPSIGVGAHFAHGLATPPPERDDKYASASGPERQGFIAHHGTISPPAEAEIISAGARRLMGQEKRDISAELAEVERRLEELDRRRRESRKRRRSSSMPRASYSSSRPVDDPMRRRASSTSRKDSYGYPRSPLYAQPYHAFSAPYSRPLTPAWDPLGPSFSRPLTPVTPIYSRRPSYDRRPSRSMSPSPYRQHRRRESDDWPFTGAGWPFGDVGDPLARRSSGAWSSRRNSGAWEPDFPWSAPRPGYADVTVPRRREPELIYATSRKPPLTRRKSFITESGTLVDQEVHRGDGVHVVNEFRSKPGHHSSSQHIRISY